MESIVEGFQVGGVDYITKPFRHEEVGARVKTHLTIKQLRDGLREANKKIEAQREAAEQELQDARQVQMSLMPEVAPSIEGLEIAGKCIPANTVSGDFFDYLAGKGPNEIALVVADVTGKAMKGAMNAVMADGILRMAAEEMERLSPSSLLMKLNGVLKARTERNMNVTMVIGMINASNKTLTLANAGALPLFLRDGKVLPFELGELPLGIKAGSEYTEKQFPLQSGDVLILMTDGIIEMQNSDEQFYSESGRLEKTITQFTHEMPAEAMVDAIINDAIDFGGDKATRDDDMTVVVAKVL
jgi:serine phosphatase RsbU (regulator of sigma subunit)